MIKYDRRKNIRYSQKGLSGDKINRASTQRPRPREPYSTGIPS